MNYLKKTLKYLLLKIKWKNKLIFSFTSHISWNSHFEGYNKIYQNTTFIGSLGLGSYISENCYIEGKIGRFCSIAPQVKVITGTHPYTYPYVTTSPFFFSNKRQNGKSIYDEPIFEEFKYAEDKYPIIIENDCWIGYGAKIISGVKIANGAIILAGAVVTKDVPSYAIVGGIPAKIIKYRYKQHDIDFLNKFQWWNKNISWLNSNKQLLVNINLLKERVKNKLT